MPFSHKTVLADQLRVDIASWQANRLARRFTDIIRNALDIADDPNDLIDEIYARLGVRRAVVEQWKKGPPYPTMGVQQAVVGYIERRLSAP